MKNRTREGKTYKKGHQRISHPPITKLHKKKPLPAKRSPPTRDFATDLTSDFQPVATSDPSPPSEPSSTPSEISPYLTHIVEHLLLNDQHFTTRVTACLASNSDFGESKISTEMRKVLLRWLIQVGKKFQVKDETLQICVQIIDYLLLFQANLISKSNFQLLGVTALFVASKYNEIHTFEAEKYVYLCDGLYTIQQLFEMESLILSATNFNLQFPTLHQFTGLIIQHYGLDMEAVVSDLIRLSMFNCLLFNRFQKQHLSSVIIYFAAKLKELPILKSKDLIEELGVPEETFKECFKLLLDLYRSREDIK